MRNPTRLKGHGELLNRIDTIVSSLLWAAVLVNIVRSAPLEASDKAVEVFVGITPTAYFVERIAGDRASVKILVKPGQDPHTFSPSPRQMMSLSKAAMFFTVGMPFEKRLVEKFAGREQGLVIFPVDSGIVKRSMTADHPGGRDKQARLHHDREPDPHVWLAPSLIKIQAENMAAAFVETDPVHAEEYRRNLSSFLDEVDAVDARIRKILEPYKGRAFYVFHPSFGYFADAYGLKQIAIEEEGREPTPRQLSRLMERARSENVRVVFAQPQFDEKSARIIAEAIGGEVVLVDPLAKDVLRNLGEIALAIERAMK